MYQFGSFGLSIKPGEQPYAVVVCAGIGDMTKPHPDFEMRDSCQEAFGDSVHQLFVRDMSRAWYQQPEGWDALLEALGAYCLEHSIEHVAIMGLSMGGYGALELSRALPYAATASLKTFNVVALSTRTRLLPIPAFDFRNTELLRQIPPLRQPPLWQSLHSGAHYTLVFAIDELEDTLHAWHVARREDIQVLAATGSHNVAHQLRVEGKLTLFLQQLFSPSVSARLVAEVGFFPPKPAHFALAIARHDGYPVAQQEHIATSLTHSERPDGF